MNTTRSRNSLIGFYSFGVSLFSFILFSMPLGVLGQEEPFAKNGFYIGGIFPFNHIGGDFDGEMVLVGNNEAIVVPEFDSGVGFGFAIGGRFNQAALELNYLRSRHDVSFQGFEFGEADYNLVNFNGKIFFNVHQPAQPFLLAGIG